MDMKSTNPKKAYGVLKPGIQYIPPVALLEEGVVMALGASKYDPFNWQDKPVDATTYYDAAMRHLMSWYTGEDKDEESGASHLAHARACMGILMDAQASGILIDDRPKTTSASETIKRLTKKKPAPEPEEDKNLPRLQRHPILKSFYHLNDKDYSTRTLEDWIVSPGCNCDGCAAAEAYRAGRID